MNFVKRRLSFEMICDIRQVGGRIHLGKQPVAGPVVQNGSKPMV